MHLSGLQKMTLLDYPGKVACTVFTSGCNFRCPFCHNASLVVEIPSHADVTEEELLLSWKNFFGNGTNWKDLDKNITYEKYRAISDKEHIRKIMQMPVHFLQESGKGFFVKKDGYALALREELEAVIDNPAFVEQMRDVIEYRTMDYYQRRYRMKSEG